VPPLLPRRSFSPRQSVATIHAVFAQEMKARPSDSVFEATNEFTYVAARGLAHHPRDGFVDRLQKFSCWDRDQARQL
jgi:hypothetical protein